jgi:Family of unknown function (DUF6261)
VQEPVVIKRGVAKMGKTNKLATNVRVTELNSVADIIITEYKKANISSDAFLTGIIEELQALNAKLTEAINRIKAESNLAEKDELRDSKVRAVNYLTKGFVHHPDITINTAAKIIDEVIYHYGIKLVKESYATESSLIESLLIDLSNADLQASIALLPGLSELIDQLRAAQTIFEEAQVIFEKEKAEEGNKENASDIKQKVIVIINEKLIVYLRAMVLVNEAMYGKFVRTVAQTIDDVNTIIKKRKKTTEIKTGQHLSIPKDSELSME